MSIPIGKIVTGVLRTAASVVGINVGGNVLEEAAKVLERVQDTPEMRVALREHEQEMKKLANEEMQIANQEALAMIASEDKFVSRARPTGLYLFYVAAISLVIAHIFGKTIDPTFVWSVLAPLAGTGGLYVWKRTQEKLT